MPSQAVNIELPFTEFYEPAPAMNDERQLVDAIATGRLFRREHPDGLLSVHGCFATLTRWAEHLTFGIGEGLLMVEDERMPVGALMVSCQPKLPVGRDGDGADDPRVG